MGLSTLLIDEACKMAAGRKGEIVKAYHFDVKKNPCIISIDNAGTFREEFTARL